MYLAVRCYEMGRYRIERRPVHAGDASTGFGDDEGSSRDIPGLQMLLPERIEAPGGDIAEVKRRRAESPHCPCLAEERAKQAHQVRGLLMHIVRKAGHEQRINQLARRRHAESRAIEVGTLPAFRRE